MPAVRLAGRTANTVTAAERFQAPRAPPPHLLRTRDRGFRLDRGFARPSLSRPRVASPRGPASVETVCRLERICLRDHPQAPPCFTLDPRWVRNALGQVRCEPVLLRAAQRFLRLFRRPAPIRGFVASFRCARVCERRPGWCAEHLVVAPAWSPVRRYRRPARQRVSPGPGQRLRALSPLSRA